MTVCRPIDMNIFGQPISSCLKNLQTNLPLAVNTPKMRHVCISLIYSDLSVYSTILAPHGKPFERQKHCINDNICMLLRSKVMQIVNQSDAV